MSSFLDADAIRAAVGSGLWTCIDVVDETASTNADLAAASRTDAPGGLVLMTAHQNAGRGRFDRAWTAPPQRSVATSVLVYPRRPLAEWGWLSLLVGIAVVDGLRAATALDAVLKWPNDVLVADRKICGILCEAVPTARGTAAILGWGINVSLTDAELPVPTATSVRLEGSDASATAIAIEVLRALERHYAGWDAGGSLADAYRARCSTVGQKVAVNEVPERTVLGRAVDIDRDGCLVVDTGLGRRSFAAGDVVHLRRSDPL